MCKSVSGCTCGKRKQPKSSILRMRGLWKRERTCVVGPKSAEKASDACRLLWDSRSLESMHNFVSFFLGIHRLQFRSCNSDWSKFNLINPRSYSRKKNASNYLFIRRCTSNSFGETAHGLFCSETLHGGNWRVHCWLTGLGFSSRNKCGRRRSGEWWQEAEGKQKEMNWVGKGPQKNLA